MCENQNDCINPAATVISAPTVEDAKNAYNSGLLSDIENFQADFNIEKENGARFNELYLCYILMAISEQNLGVLDEAVKELQRNEVKYINK